MEEKRAKLSGVEISHYDEGGGEAVVFVHGLGGYKENWEFNVPYFARGHRAVALDLPGFGHSDKPKREYTMEFFVETAREFMDRLRIEKATLVGNSMGGMISAAFALAHPDRVARLALVDAAGINIFPPNLMKMDDLPIQVFAVASGVERDPAKREQVVRRYIRRLIFFTEPPVLEKMVQHALREFFGNDFQGRAHAFMSSAQNALLAPLKARLREIQAPTWIVWGDRDALLPLENAHAFKQALPHSTLTVVPECGHCPMLEYPDRFNAELESFLAA
ncbi:MAG: alpha/beta hydrolase [Nitrospirae bacterium]|nr:alpha/beta hydrolase [Nitrospirota bacterium]